MAPELFRGERPSRASDIYAFGLLIDEMVTRAPAFSADSLHGLMLQKLHDGPSRPAVASGRDLPTDLGAGHPALSRGRSGRALRAGVRRLPRARSDRPRRVAATPPAAGACPARREVRGRRRRRRRGDRQRWPWRRREAPGVQSVVVLPFVNLTGDPGDDYLSAGTAGELWHRLSRVPGLRVSAPPRVAGEPVDPQRRATYALSGHVQRVGTNLRITVQLADQQRDRLVWSQNYEGPRERALQLEDALAEEAAAALSREAMRGSERRSVAVVLAGAVLRPDASGGPGRRHDQQRSVRRLHARTLPVRAADAARGPRGDPPAPARDRARSGLRGPVRDARRTCSSCSWTSTTGRTMSCCARRRSTPRRPWR